MVGLGSTLLNMGRLDEGMRVLAGAEEWDARNPDVLAALARGYRFRGELSLALDYINRAVAIAPTPDHRLAREQILRQHAHRVEVNAFEERFTAAIPRGQTGDIGINLRVTDRLRVSARGQRQHKFDVGERRFGAGIDWRARPDTMLGVAVLGGRDNTVLPQADLNIESSHTRGRTEWQGGYRFVRFADADVSVVSPGVVFSLRETVLLGGRYYAASTTFRGSPAVTSHAGALRIAVQVHPRVWTTGGYARGTENFETLSPDRIGSFRADTASAGVRFELPQLTTLAGTYEYQRRTRGTNMGRLTASIIQRF